MIVAHERRTGRKGVGRRLPFEQLFAAMKIELAKVKAKHGYSTT
jgi:hypothetical protein